MTRIRFMTAAMLVAISTTALAQGGTNGSEQSTNVNRTGTIGPTIIANPPSKDNAVRTPKDDPDAGRYGVPGGVGDPSVGSNLTAANPRFRSAPVGLRARAAHERRPARRH